MNELVPGTKSWLSKPEGKVGTGVLVALGGAAAAGVLYAWGSILPWLIGVTENTIFVISHDIPSVVQVADHLWLLGRTKDEQGNPLGAKIVYEYNLADMGIAWNPDAPNQPIFHDLLREIRNRFDSL